MCFSWPSLLIHYRGGPLGNESAGIFSPAPVCLSVCLGLILRAIAIQAAGGAAVTTRSNSCKEQMEKAATSSMTKKPKKEKKTHFGFERNQYFQ